MEIQPKVIHRFNTISIKNLKYYFTKMKKKSWTSYRNTKIGYRIPKTILYEKGSTTSIKSFINPYE